MKIDGFLSLVAARNSCFFIFLSPTVGSNNVTETIVVSGVRLTMLRKCDSHGGLYMYIYRH
jgi:hypothetical protein